MILRYQSQSQLEEAYFHRRVLIHTQITEDYPKTSFIGVDINGCTVRNRVNTSVSLLVKE